MLLSNWWLWSPFWCFYGYLCVVIGGIDGLVYLCFWWLVLYICVVLFLIWWVFLGECANLYMCAGFVLLCVVCFCLECLVCDFIFFIFVCLVVGDVYQLLMRILWDLGVGMGSSTLLFLFLWTFFKFSPFCIIFPFLGFRGVLYYFDQP